MDLPNKITCKAAPNLAVAKYWGKRNVPLNLPINSSLSGTLDLNDLCTTTTAMVSPGFSEDKLWLNGKEEDVTKGRFAAVLKEIRKRAVDQERAKLHVHVASINNFPTAAGLASSASGFCALVFVLSKLYGVSGDISSIARIGSGSACRSLYGGWVEWDMGKDDETGADSIAIQVADERHWPEMRILILVASDEKKKVASTAGMQQSVQTSPLIEERKKVMPARMNEFKKSILAKDFETLGHLTMLDSDHFHEVCHTTTPPIHYMNETSKAIVRFVKEFNKPKIRAAYTFDAGPNAVIYIPNEHLEEFTALLLNHFPPEQNKSIDNEYLRDPSEEGLLKRVIHSVGNKVIPEFPVQSGLLRYILLTRVGSGPKIIEQHLLNETGTPVVH